MNSTTNKSKKTKEDKNLEPLWYKFLNHKQGRNQEECLFASTSFKLNEGRPYLIIAKETKTKKREYALFASEQAWYNFYKYYKTLLDKNERCYFHEMGSTSNNRLQMMFDIDMACTDKNLFNSVVGNLIECFSTILKKDFNIELDKEKIVFLTSHGKDKHSAHVITGIDVPTSSGKTLCVHVKEIMNPIYAKYIDDAIYGDKKLMRLLYSYKRDSDRQIIFENKWFCGDEEITCRLDDLEIGSETYDRDLFLA